MNELKTHIIEPETEHITSSINETLDTTVTVKESVENLSFATRDYFAQTGKLVFNYSEKDFIREQRYGTHFKQKLFCIQFFKTYSKNKYRE